MKEYTKEQLIKLIINYSKELGRSPKIRDVAYNKELPPINQFLKVFKTWNNILKEADLKVTTVGQYSKDYLINKLREIHIKLKRSPKILDFENDKQLPSPAPYFEHFGSWNNALKIAGLKINIRKDYTNKELSGLLRKKAMALGRSPKIDEINTDKNMPDRDTYERHFGSFNKALESAGLEVKYLHRKWTKDDIVRWLQYKYEELGKTPGIRDFDNDPKAPAKNTVRKLFGNWTNALRQAKIPVKRFNSTEELISLMKKLAKKLNKTPTRTDMNNAKSFPSYTPFVEKFGSYAAACLRAGLIPNDGRNNKIWQAWEKHCIEMAKILHNKIEIKSKCVVEGVPDILIADKKLLIDAKTCGYRDFGDQIKKYCKNGHKLEFWCIFKGIENRSKKVKYVYAEELAKIMKNLKRNDLSAKCHQFIRNVYSDEQTVLSPKTI